MEHRHRVPRAPQSFIRESKEIKEQTFFVEIEKGVISLKGAWFRWWLNNDDDEGQVPNLQIEKFEHIVKNKHIKYDQLLL